MTGYAKNYTIPLKRSDTRPRVKGKTGGVPMAEINNGLFDALDSMPTRTSCALCSWTFHGTAAEGRQEARSHREREHPELLLVKSKRKRRRARTPPREVR